MIAPVDTRVLARAGLLLWQDDRGFWYWQWEGLHSIRGAPSLSDALAEAFVNVLLYLRFSH